MRLPLAATLVVLLFISHLRADEAPKPPGEKITLRLKLKKGEQKSVVHRFQLSTVTTTDDKQRFEGTAEMATHLRAAIDQVDPETNHMMTITIGRITGTVDKSKFDSDEPRNNESETPVAFAKIGVGFSFKIKPDGTAAATISDELIKTLSTKLPEGADPRKEIEKLQATLQQWIFPFPQKPVGVGDTWKSRAKLPDATGQPADVEATYKLESRKDGVAVIRLEAPLPNAGFKGRITGTVHLDEATGWIVNHATVTQATLDAGGNTIEINVKSTASEK